MTDKKVVRVSGELVSDIMDYFGGIYDVNDRSDMDYLKDLMGWGLAYMEKGEKITIECISDVKE